MKIFITGASGFVGAHSALALRAAGHELRLLVRRADAVRRYFAAQGQPIAAGGPIELVVADMNDAKAVRDGIAGCDAVLHAAAAVSLSAGQAQQTYDNNIGGLRTVVGAACGLGLRSIVYVSSVSVLFRPGLTRIDEQTPLAPAADPYSRSKRDGDAWVQELQQQGCPVQICYPSAVVGPDDPKLSKANYGVQQFVATLTPNTSSGFQCVDVRDLAGALRYMLEHVPAGAATDARYIVGGHYYAWAELRRLLATLTGRRLPAPPLPGALLRGIGTLVDVATRIVPFDTTLTAEAMAYATQWSPADSGKFLRHSGLKFRDGAETFADALRWLARAGHVHPRQIGRLYAAPDPALKDVA